MIGLICLGELKMTVVFSLIVATFGRLKDLDYLLESLVSQSFREFEVIIVDQNPIGYLDPLINKYKSRLNLLYCRSEKGLSKARNVGISLSSGVYIGFPDDDCWYKNDTLETVLSLFNQTEGVGITGSVVDERDEPTMGRWPTRELEVKKDNIFECAISFSIFLKRDLLVKVGNFNEQLGVGSGTVWGSGEETDLLLRYINYGKVYYYPELKIHHPDKTKTNLENMTRAYLYGAGFGRVLRLNDYSFISKIYYVIRSLIASSFYLLKRDVKMSKFHFYSFLGRVRGLFVNNRQIPSKFIF